MPTDLDRFAAACVYPGKLDEQAVERELAAFLQALGERRRIVRLRAARRPEDDPPLDRNFVRILAQCVRRNFLVRAFRVGAERERHLRATLDDDADFPSDDRVARAAVDALAARRASDAGAADAALARRRALANRADYVAVVFFVAGLMTFAALFVHLALRDAGADILAALAGLAFVAALVVFFVSAPLLAFAGVVDSLFPRRAADAAPAFAGFAADPEARASRTNCGSMWELSWTVCALFHAVERRKLAVAWLRPLFEAFVCGCWLLYWTDDTLYWVAKPTVRWEPGTRRLRLHHDTHAAIESDVVKLYFWHGVRVPPFVILSPDLITIARIDQETNAEVRRAMIERYRHGEEIRSAAAFIRDAGGRRIDHDERYGTLWRRRIFVGAGEATVEDDEPIVMIEVINRTPEPDSSFKHYWLRVPPTMRTAREAVAWTFPDFWGSTENGGFSLYRQGDVLIIPVEWIPEKLDPVDRENGRVVLAHGEVTGHAHAIMAEGAALFRDPKLMAVFMRVSGDAPVALEHDDHDTIMIPPGKYQVVRQREYSPGAVREAYRYVAD